ncbi:MAG: hypothetical protein A2Y33_09975 [Spirochaetes bacterium GWF1_51_8]|nr:MAG: hypothetical protein A2Y33_09975 [Spirochaetes bacterium GWF1_51_8]
MKRRIFYKIFSGFFIVILLLLVVNQLAVVLFINDFSGKASFDYIEKMGKVIAADLSAPLENSDLTEAQQVFTRFTNIPGLQIALADRDGNVLPGFKSGSEEFKNLPLKPEFQLALLGMTGQSPDLYSGAERESLSIAMPFSDNANSRYILLLVSSVSRELSLMNNLFVRLAGIAVILLVLSLAVTFFISKGFTNPIYDLVNAAGQVAKGNFRTRVIFEKEDEFKVLAESFNSMTSQIRFLFEELNAEREELRAIIYTMQGALCVIDEDDTIIFSNESFRKMTGSEKPEGSPYWEYIRDNALDNIILKVRGKKIGVIEELEIEKKYYLLSAENAELKNHIIMTLSDISELKKAESFKKNLIDNVSHELKTPLTSIVGFVETLISDEKDPEKLRYLGIVSRNVSRLTNIVNDLLSYSGLEHIHELDLEEFELVKFVRELSAIFEKRLDEKGLKLSIKSEGEAIVTADRYQMEKVFFNLIDNAIKYSDKGEISIEIVPSTDGVTVGIRDSGIGIPKEHLGRIFERFYVVDKSRSRELGGTGLGLAIVRKIVQLHGGEIKAESNYGEGTEFKIFLPLNRD